MEDLIISRMLQLYERTGFGALKKCYQACEWKGAGRVLGVKGHGSKGPWEIGLGENQAISG